MSVLKDIFSGDQDRLADWWATDEATMTAAEELLQRATELGVDGLSKLHKDAGDLSKFRNILAEVRFANILAQDAASVKIFEDDCFPRKSADLHVTYSDGYSLLVEVRRGSSGDPDFRGELDKALKLEKVPFSIGYNLGWELGLQPGLSRSGTTGSERTIQEQERDAVIAQVVDELKKCTPGSSGVISVGAHEITYAPSLTESGCVLGGLTGVAGYRPEAHEQLFIRDICKKSENPKTFPEEWSAIPYVIAYEAEQHELSTICIFQALVGRSVLVPRPDGERRSIILSEIENYPHSVQGKMRSPEWKKLFDAWGAWGFSEEGFGHFIDFGVFVEEAWSKEVAGVLVRHPSRECCQWIPNPWGRLSTPRLLDLGFSYTAPPHDEYPF